jgi:hypothetical protein
MIRNAAAATFSLSRMSGFVMENPLKNSQLVKTY